MTRETEEALLVALSDLTEAVKELRADLKRREARDLKAEGRIPNATDRSPANGDGPCFGNFGRSKGQPVAGAALADLEYYAAAAQRSLTDSSKARFHAKERVLLAAIKAEIMRQGGGGAQGRRAEPEQPVDNPLDDDLVPF